MAIHNLRQLFVVRHLFAPKVLRRNRAGRAVFVQFNLKRDLAIKREILQHALTKAVNGVNGGVVKLAQRGFESHH